jgi:DNA-binding PadR family transcriptional regulator
MNDILILASLLSGPKHGYLIKKEAGLILRGSELHNNLVYPLLHRFERRGWVGKRKARGERGQTRLEYFLKPAGRAELIRRLERYPDAENSDAAFYVRAGLFDLLPAPSRPRILGVREEELERLSSQLERITAELRPGGYAAEVVRYMRRKTQFELVWVRSLNQTVTKSRRRKASAAHAPKNGRALRGMPSREGVGA